VLASLSLRARLVLAVIALAAVGLVVADLVTYSALRSFLVDRVDRSLSDTAHSIRGGPGFEQGRGRGGPRPAGPGVLVQVRSASGDSVLATLPSATAPGRSAPTPRLPDDPAADPVRRSRSCPLSHRPRRHRR
jgi:hypothetical protein